MITGFTVLFYVLLGVAVFGLWNDLPIISNTFKGKEKLIARTTPIAVLLAPITFAVLFIILTIKVLILDSSKQFSKNWKSKNE